MLADITGKPMLFRIIERCKQALLVDDVIIATTPNSLPIIDFCIENDISHIIASVDESDILGRLYEAALKFKADIIIRVWGDCPLIEGEDIDYAIRCFGLVKPPYLTYRTWGGIIGVLGFDTLAKAHVKIKDNHDRQWIHEKLRTSGVTMGIDENPISVDTQADLERVREIYVSR